MGSPPGGQKEKSGRVQKQLPVCLSVCLADDPSVSLHNVSEKSDWGREDEASTINLIIWQVYISSWTLTMCKTDAFVDPQHVWKGTKTGSSQRASKCA